MSKPVVRDTERFRYFTNDRAVIPPGYSAPLKMRFVREVTDERLRESASKKEA